MKGIYLLLVKLENNKLLSYGIKNKSILKKGFYVYVGSGLNSLEKRIERHLKKNKKFYWHIDYLLKYSIIVKVYYMESNEQIECKISELLQKNFSQINNFGSSDCKCNSHLFYVSKNKFIDFIKKLVLT